MRWRYWEHCNDWGIVHDVEQLTCWKQLSVAKNRSFLLVPSELSIVFFQQPKEMRDPGDVIHWLGQANRTKVTWTVVLGLVACGTFTTKHHTKQGRRKIRLFLYSNDTRFKYRVGGPPRKGNLGYRKHGLYYIDYVNTPY